MFIWEPRGIRTVKFQDGLKLPSASPRPNENGSVWSRTPQEQIALSHCDSGELSL